MKVVYHANCADGFCSAWIAYNALSGDAELVPASYGDVPPDCTDRHVMILDFCYPRDELLVLIEQARSVVVIDHHADRFDPERGQKYVADIPGVMGSTSYSGAMLTWRWFKDWKFTEPAPKLVQYVQDRDLWKHALPETKSINALIQSTPFKLADWNDLNALIRDDFETAVSIGNRFLNARQKRIDLVLAHTYMAEIGGYLVPCINGAEKDIISDAVGELSEGFAFAFSWVQNDDGFVYSFRSRGDGIDVSRLAHELVMGGGGHYHAAGCQSKTRLHDVGSQGAAYKEPNILGWVFKGLLSKIRAFRA